MPGVSTFELIVWLASLRHYKRSAEHFNVSKAQLILILDDFKV